MNFVLDVVIVLVSLVFLGIVGMVAGVELLPQHGIWSRLLSARRHGDFLFLRYGLRSA